MTQLSISSQFDSGAIEVLRLDVAHDIQLRIRQDTAAEFAQWFHFCLHGAAGEPVTLRFMNAKQCAYPKGWEGYQVVCSEDRQHWSRIETSYDGEVMTARVTPQTNAIYFAYFEPYSYEQHLDLLASAAASSLITVERLGTTVQGRDMSVLRVADVHSLVAEEDKKDVWVIARQHPGETMAEWFVEGFLERLLDADDSVSLTLLQRCNFHVVPNMNPDGAVLGNLRTNAAGANLNREWAAPSMERSPEVALVRQAMEATGVDLCLDVHGDEALPCNFVVGSEGTPGYTPRIAELEDDFKTDWMRACPDFQDTLNYGRVAAGQANMSLATNWIAQRFGCMALTIEMPFKDNVNLPDPTTGWSGQRSKKLGASVLQPLLQWSV